MAARIPTFREVEDEVGALLRSQGALAAILVDLEPLARVERGFGGAAYKGLREQVDPLMLEVTERVRNGDILTRDEREGDRFLLLLGPKRTQEPFRIADLRRLTGRVEAALAPRLARLTQPYLRERAGIEVGYGFVLYSPLEGSERQILRLIEDARACADLRRLEAERGQREQLLEIVHNRSVWTAFQPILELERACRRQAFLDWGVFGAPGRLFINTVPATVRDPSFMGRGLLEYLGEGLSPRLVTLEITEGQVIENLSLYREAMLPFIDMGFSFAIDDVGAGYSGLETIASLGASYLKIDMSLVRDVHQKRVGQQMIKAIVDMGAGTAATVIAEGIQSLEEAEALVSLGVRYGQGYLFARPIDPYAPKLAPAVRAAIS